MVIRPAHGEIAAARSSRFLGGIRVQVWGMQEMVIAEIASAQVFGQELREQLNVVRSFSDAKVTSDRA